MVLTHLLTKTQGVHAHIQSSNNLLVQRIALVRPYLQERTVKSFVSYTSRPLFLKELFSNFKKPESLFDL